MPVLCSTPCACPGAAGPGLKLLRGGQDSTQRTHVISQLCRPQSEIKVWGILLPQKLQRRCPCPSPSSRDPRRLGSWPRTPSPPGPWLAAPLGRLPLRLCAQISRLTQHQASGSVLLVWSLRCVRLFGDSVDSPGSSVYGIFQARILRSVAAFSSGASSRLRGHTWGRCVSSRGRRGLHLSPQGEPGPGLGSPRQEEPGPEPDHRSRDPVSKQGMLTGAG